MIKVYYYVDNSPEFNIMIHIVNRLMEWFEKYIKANLDEFYFILLVFGKDCDVSNNI